MTRKDRKLNPRMVQVPSALVVITVIVALGLENGEVRRILLGTAVAAAMVVLSAAATVGSNQAQAMERRVGHLETAVADARRENAAVKKEVRDQGQRIAGYVAYCSSLDLGQDIPTSRQRSA